MGIFNQPFPRKTTLKSRLITAAAFGLFVFLFLSIFQPFSMYDSVRYGMLFISGLFGAVAAVSILISHYSLEILAPRFFDEEKWTTGKHLLSILFTLFLVGTINVFLFPLLYDTELSWRNYYRSLIFTLSVGFLPIIIYTLIRQNRWLHQFRDEAAMLQQKLEEKKKEEAAAPAPVTTVNEQQITLTGDNQKETITLHPHDLVYLESASNYVKIYFEHKGKLSYSILRSTMKKVTESLDDHEMFFRCHRAFIVNLDKVEQVEGNAQGYKLKIAGTGDRVPVSRNLNHEFADRLLALKKEMVEMTER